MSINNLTSHDIDKDIFLSLRIPLNARTNRDGNVEMDDGNKED